MTDSMFSDVDIRVVYATPPIPIPEWLREELGLPAPKPEPTTEEKALAILEPHLVREPLYWKTG